MMGVNLARVRLLQCWVQRPASVLPTAVAGAIGFVGLVVPHLLRPLVSSRPSRLLVASGFSGAALLLAADILVRIVMPGRELKLGVLTAIIGAPFFLAGFQISEAARMTSLSVKNLSVTLGGKGCALNDASFAIQDGEFIGLIGPNGAERRHCCGLSWGLLRREERFHSWRRLAPNDGFGKSAKACLFASGA